MAPSAGTPPSAAAAAAATAITAKSACAAMQTSTQGLGAEPSKQTAIRIGDEEQDVPLTTGGTLGGSEQCLHLLVQR